MPMRVERSVSIHGRESILCNGYRMRHQYTAREHRTWRCNKPECDARVATDVDCTLVKRVYKWHNHGHIRKWTPRKTTYKLPGGGGATVANSQDTAQVLETEASTIASTNVPKTERADTAADDAVKRDDVDSPSSEKSGTDSTIHIEVEQKLAADDVTGADDVSSAMFSFESAADNS